jgi:hypothetical protein
MPAERFLLVTDTPGIKSFVFGTDALAEVRGASALLDRLNRVESKRVLREHLPAGGCETVFANGGTGQFVLHAEGPEVVEQAVKALACHYRDETGGEMRLVWGLAPWPADASVSYREAARDAYFQLRTVRETASAVHASPCLPLLHECSSTSYLPALTEPYRWGGESLLLSEAARLKREASRRAAEGTLWTGWMEDLARRGPWPEQDSWPRLRAGDAVALEKARKRKRPPARKGYVGLVYADGNAMGRLVQELDSREACATFSQIVDESVRKACYRALGDICAGEIAAQRARPENPKPLPADILLLGGDDLLVLLPADDALAFALGAMKAFEDLTRERIQALPPGDGCRFFEKTLGIGKGMTISCGIALAPVKYPFYLLLDLAEHLLASAKRGGSSDPERGDYWAPSYADFHLVVGPAGADLEVIREEDYRVGNSKARPRTLRPYRREKLEQLCGAVALVQQARLPRSKLQDLFDAALDPRPARAELHARELFGRLRQDRTHNERRALWGALRELGMNDDFPWCPRGDGTATALADLVEACDLFPRPEES